MTHHTGSVPETKRKADWREQGLCATHDQPDIFFAPSGSPQEAEAVTVCGGCPVRATCQQSAINNREAYGTWGGMTERQRRTLLKIRVNDGTDEPRKGGRPRAACGTASAYDRHVKYGEPIDDACRTAHAAASAERRARDKQKTASKREPAKCSTRPGYQKHLRENTTVCGPCRQANTDADNRLRRTGTTRQQAAA